MELTYVGAPTALLAWQGRRLLTDPTFDPASPRYELPGHALRKTQSPAIAPEQLGGLDAVLLSHDHHFDNLDHTGRALLPRSGCVLTTRDGAARVAEARGLDPWEHVDLDTPAWPLRAIATPARHGPAGGDRGPVIGFVISIDDNEPSVYVSGDTAGFSNRLRCPRAGAPITLL